MASVLAQASIPAFRDDLPTAPARALAASITALAGPDMSSHIQHKQVVHIEYIDVPNGSVAASDFVPTHALRSSPPRSEPLPSAKLTDDASSVYSNDSEVPHSEIAHKAGPTSYSDAGHYSLATYSRITSHRHLSHAPPVTATAPTDQQQLKYRALADASTRDPPSVFDTPLPVPPKLPTDPRYVKSSRTLSVVAPSDPSHARSHEECSPAFDNTVSEPGHSSIYSATTSTSLSSGRVPRVSTSHSHSSPGYLQLHSSYNYPSRLSWADKASVPIYFDTLPMHGPPTDAAFTDSPSHRRRKLRKPLPRSSLTISSQSAPPSSSSSRIWRALSLRGTSSEEIARINANSKTLSGFFKCRHSEHLSREFDGGAPIRTPSGSGSSESHYYSSTTSHSLSSSGFPSSAEHSTPATTPELSPAVSPLDSPIVECASGAQGIGKRSTLSLTLDRTTSSGPGTPRKLKKRRPSIAQSPATAPQVAGTHRSELQEQSTSHDYLPPIRPTAPLGFDIPRMLGQSDSVPLLPAKRKSSTNALAQLAWTGFSSSELAALTSRLSMQAQTSERTAQAVAQDADTQSPAFDPYREAMYASGANANSTRINEVGDMDASEEGSSLGHAVTSTFSTMRKRMKSTIREGNTMRHTRTNSLPMVRLSQTSHLPASAVRPDSTLSESHCAPRPHMSKQAPKRLSSFVDSDPMAMRRWTLALADVPDEILVQELDKLRKEGVVKRTRGKSRTPAGSMDGHGSECGSTEMPGLPISPGWRLGSRFEIGAYSDSEDEEDGTIEEWPENEADEEEWRTARSALLCCRELVRTERNYQTRLRQLLTAKSSHPLFSLMLSYVPALLLASEALLVRLMDDPSAWGVSAAFIGCEEELEAAFVAWCGIVGEFFADDAEKDKRGRKMSRKTSEEVASALGHGDVNVRPRAGTTTFMARSPSQGGLAFANPKPTGGRRMSMVGANELHEGMFTAALGTGLAWGLSPLTTPHPAGFSKHMSTASIEKENARNAAGTISRTLSAWKRKSVPSSLSHLPMSLSIPSSPTLPAGSKEEKKLAVRDLAIQPTQRVMRYVLQYKDLLKHTPVTSPSRGLVERALDSALRIAKQCDRAQGNSVFLRRP